MNKEAAKILAEALEKDALDHESGNYDNIGLKWDDVYGQLLPIEEDIDHPVYGLALNFWDDWCDASNHDWKYHEPIKTNEWPKIAREIATSLRTGTLPNNKKILDHFLPKPKEGILEKIKTWILRDQKKSQ